MLDKKREYVISENKIFSDILGMLNEILSDDDMGFEQSIGPETYLGAELDMNSIDIVRLIQAIQTKYNRVDLPFEDLFMPGNNAVSDVRIIDFVNFLCDHLYD
jgi:acyl carrier protein